MASHSFVFNSDCNGGEQLILTTDFTKDDNGEVWIEQSLTLNSYANSATFTLCGATLTPNKLRQLANELEQKMNIV